ncbi:MAG: tetratricopeptide repeat protein, partial [Isosphaeraceae bacterium]
MFQEGADRDLPLDAESRYRVLWPHAMGGLGQIYVAEDQELHRRVALKEIRPEHAMDPVSRERFVVEAEVTGKMEHPGIVPVHGLGVHRDGRPFYAMRFIKGENLTTAIRQFHGGAANFAGREFRWLLRRFIDVCNTIAYAHSRGVLHRDLKPSNVMLGPFGETLVLDWGVAKAAGIGEPGAASAEFSVGDDPILRTRWGSSSGTAAGQAVGTPAYMSPEQAEGKLEAIGPASDVYNLGATLYVLLTNRRPFEGEPDDVIQAVRGGRFRAPIEIIPRVPRALDAVCRRAMALLPSRRYPSALALAEDIERWLADEPVSAWQEPAVVRARRWLRRHQPLVAGWAAAFAVALIGLSVAVPLLSLAWRNEAHARHSLKGQYLLTLKAAEEVRAQRRRAVENLQEANQQRALAQAHASAASDEKHRAEQALKFLVETFRKPDPSADGRSLKVVELLDHAVKDLERSLAGQELMQATLYTAIGQTYTGLGMPRESFVVFERAFEIRRAKLGESRPETLESMNNLASAYHDAGRFDLAIPLLETTLAGRRALLGEDHHDAIETMNDLAVAYWKNGQASRSIPLYEATFAKIRVELGDDHVDTLTVMDNLAVAYTAAGKPEKAIPLHQKALAKLRTQLGDEHPTTVITVNNLGRTYEAAGRVGEAIELLEKSLEKLRSRLTDDHPTTLTAMRGLAKAYHLSGQPDRAISLYEATLGKQRIKLGDDHPDTLLSLFELAKAHASTGKSARARLEAREFIERAKKIDYRLPQDLRSAIPAAGKLLDV